MLQLTQTIESISTHLVRVTVPVELRYTRCHWSRPCVWCYRRGARLEYAACGTIVIMGLLLGLVSRFDCTKSRCMIVTGIGRADSLTNIVLGSLL